MATWSDRNQPSKGTHLLVSGRAYPKVHKGQNRTNVAVADVKDRNAWYWDDAVMLSDADMNKYDGGKGLPLCVEHDENDVVGVVRYGFIGDGDQRSLKIWAKVPTETTSHQRDVVEKIKSGYYKGLSVGYGIVPANGVEASGGTKKIASKRFKEISLVKEPFFEGCDLSWNVTASKEGINNQEYKSKTGDRLVYSFEIDTMSEVQNTDNAPAPAQAQEPAPAQQNAVQAEEILKEAEKLNTQLDEQKKHAETAASKLAEMEKELAYHRAKEAKEAEEYKAAQMPKFKQWLEIEEADKPMPEKMKNGYEQAWTDIRYKDNASKLEEQMNRVISLQASAKAAEEKAKKLEEEKAALEQSVTASANAVKSMNARASVASAISKDAPTNDRKETDINASLNLNEIMLRGPSDAELPFLQSFGYSSEIDVNASRHDRYGGGKEFLRSIRAPVRSKQDRDEDGNLNFPASARNIPGCDGIFAFMVENRDLRTADLSDVVSINASKNTIVRKDADEWEQKNLARMVGRQ